MDAICYIVLFTSLLLNVALALCYYMANRRAELFWSTLGDTNRQLRQAVDDIENYDANTTLTGHLQ